MLRTFLQDLVKEIKAIFKEERDKPSVKHNPVVQKKSADTEVWIVEGIRAYDNAKHLNYSDTKCIFIRAKWRGEWYMVNKQGSPIGVPCEKKATDQWKLVKQIG